MRIAILSFSSEGQLLGRRLREALEDRGSDCTLRRCPEGGLREWTQNHFLSNEALIFVGSCGLAVRAIAPFVQSKSSDPAVLVIDETGKFVISLLSGHLGGANELTKWVAEQLSATPVITTATDRRGLFAVDSWARKNGYFVSNPEKIKEVSSALLEGKTVTFCSDFPISGQVPEQLRLLQMDRSESAGEMGDHFDVGAEVREQKPGEHGGEATASVPERADLPNPLMGGEALIDPFDYPTAALRREARALRQASSPTTVVSEAAALSPSASGPSDAVPKAAATTAEPEALGFSVSWQRRESEELRIVVPSLYIGIGARKGISSEAVEQLVDRCLKELKASPLAVKAVASIDLKANEEGIFECCARHAWTFLSFSQEELARVEGDFSASAFVKEVTGVDNVCERSAVLAAGQGSRLLLRKQSLDGVTCAIALEAISVNFDEVQNPQH